MGRSELSSVVFRLGFGAFVALAASGCGSDDPHQAGTPSSGQCPIGISSTQDANNNVNVLNNGAMSGDYSGPDGEGAFIAFCNHLNFSAGAHNQALEITLRGKKPAV